MKFKNKFGEIVETENYFSHEIGWVVAKIEDLVYLIMYDYESKEYVERIRFHESHGDIIRGLLFRIKGV